MYGMSSGKNKILNCSHRTNVQFGICPFSHHLVMLCKWTNKAGMVYNGKV